MATKPKAVRTPAKTSSKPSGAAQLNTYLAFDGTCAKAFRFYEKVLGGKVVMMMTYRDMPAGAGPPPAPEFADRVMHARMMIGDLPLMGGDAPPGRYSKPHGFCVNVAIANPAEAERVFKALAAGGTVTMPMAETFWARKFGMLTDKFGTPWMVNCEKPK